MQGLLQTFFFQKSFFFQNSDFFQYLFFSIINFFLQNSIFFHGQRRALHLEGNKTDIISVRAGSTSLPLVLSTPPYSRGVQSTVQCSQYIIFSEQYSIDSLINIYTYLFIYLPTCCSTYLSKLSIYLPNFLPIYLYGYQHCYC